MHFQGWFRLFGAWSVSKASTFPVNMIPSRYLYSSTSLLHHNSHYHINGGQSAKGTTSTNYFREQSLVQAVIVQLSMAPLINPSSRIDRHCVDSGSCFALYQPEEPVIVKGVLELVAVIGWSLLCILTQEHHACIMHCTSVYCSSSVV